MFAISNEKGINMIDDKLDVRLPDQLLKDVL